MSDTVDWFFRCQEGLEDDVNEYFRMEGAMANSELEAAVLYAMKHGFKENADYLMFQLEDDRQRKDQECYEQWQNSSESQKQLRLVSKSAPYELFHARVSVETDTLVKALAETIRSETDDVIEAAALYAIDQWRRSDAMERYSKSR